MQEERGNGCFDEAGKLCGAVTSYPHSSLPPAPCCLANSLQEEREKGYFDEAGNYVEREDKDAEEDAKDAWLQSDEGELMLEACSL